MIQDISYFKILNRTCHCVRVCYHIVTYVVSTHHFSILSSFGVSDILGPNLAKFMNASGLRNSKAGGSEWLEMAECWMSNLNEEYLLFYQLRHFQLLVVRHKLTALFPVCVDGFWFSDSKA